MHYKPLVALVALLLMIVIGGCGGTEPLDEDELDQVEFFWPSVPAQDQVTVKPRPKETLIRYTSPTLPWWNLHPVRK